MGYSHPERRKRKTHLQRESGPVAGPAVQTEHLTPALLLLAQVLGHAALDLHQSGAHDFAEVAL